MPDSENKEPDPDLVVEYPDHIAEASVQRWRSGAGPIPWDEARVESELDTATTRNEANGVAVHVLLDLFGTDDHEAGDVFGRVAMLTNEAEEAGVEFGPRALAISFIVLAQPPNQSVQRDDFRPWKNEMRRKSLPHDVLDYVQKVIAYKKRQPGKYTRSTRTNELPQNGQRGDAGSGTEKHTGSLQDRVDREYGG